MTLQRRAALANTSPPLQLQRAPGGPADFESAAISLARWYLEFRAGRRPWDQLQGIVTTPVRQRLRTQATTRLAAPELEPVVKALVQTSGSTRVDAVVLVTHARRVLAVTVAFARADRDAPWRVVELTTPHDDDRTLALGAEPAEGEEDQEDQEG